jgi:hypothetical protein
MCEHVTLEFLKEHSDNLLATRVVQFPFQNNRIAIYSKSIEPVIGDGSGEFVLLTSLEPDVISIEVTAPDTNTDSEPVIEPETNTDSEPTQGQ